MNYYMPYFNMYPNVISPGFQTAGAIAKANSSGIFSRLLGGFNWGTILTNTQKTLNIVNQAIPVIKQVSPVMKNAKTMFKVMNEFKKVDTPVDNTQNIAVENKNVKDEPVISSSTYNNGPTFFIN